MFRMNKWAFLSSVVIVTVGLVSCELAESDKIGSADGSEVEKCLEIDVSRKLEKVWLQDLMFVRGGTLEDAFEELAKGVDKAESDIVTGNDIRRWYSDVGHEELDMKMPKAISSIAEKLTMSSVSLAEVLDVLCLQFGKEWGLYGEHSESEVAEWVFQLSYKRAKNTVTERKLRLRILNIEFTEDTTYRQAVNFLRLKEREVEYIDPIYYKRVKFVFKDSTAPVERGGEKGDRTYGPIEERAVGKIMIENGTLAEILTVASRRAGVKWSIKDNIVEVEDR